MNLPGAGAAPAALRHHWAMLAALALLAPLYWVWSGTDQMGEFANDGPAYLLLARHFANPGQAGVVAEAAASSRVAPLYPLLLAWSGSAGDLPAVHALTTAAFLLALAAYYFWLRGMGFSASQAAAAMVLCAALPLSWLLGLTVQSEYLYLLLSLLSLGLMQRPPASGGVLFYAPAVAVCLAVLTRSVGVTLLLPLALSLRGVPLRRAGAALAVAVLPLALWHLTHRSTLSYTAQIQQIYGVAPWAHLIGQVRRELPALQAAFLTNLGAVPAWRLPLAAFGAVCVGAALWRGARGRPDAAYLAAYAAVVLVWPYPEDAPRFVWAVLPLLLVQPLLLLHELPPGRRSRVLLRGSAAACAALIGAALVPGLVRGVQRYSAPRAAPILRAYVAWYQPDFAAAQQEVAAEIALTRDLRLVQAKIPTQDCVLAVRPDLINFYTERASVQVPLNSVPDPEFQRRLRASGCRFVFMHSSTNASFPVPMHPAARLGDEVELVYYSAVANPPGSTNFAISALARFK